MPRVSARLAAVLLAGVLLPGAASAQGMLRGSLDALPGQDEQFTPYGMGTTPGFGAPPAEASPSEETGPPELPVPYSTPRRASKADPSPYEPLGIRAGAFLLKPSLTLSGGYDTNPQSRSVAEGSWYGRTRAALDVESDWIRHLLRGRIEAGYKAYENFPDENAPDFGADAALRLDVREDVRADFSLRGTVDTDTRNDPELVGITSTDQNVRVSGRAGVIYKPGRISIAPEIEAARNDYGDPSLADRDFWRYETTLRTGFELSPALEPFVEASFNQRIYDEDVNDSGIEHDSKGYRVYGGARFAPDPIWTAELKLGYGQQEARDPSIPEEKGLVGEATVIWQPTDLTRLRLSAGHDFAATARECCAVESNWFANAGFDHEFRDWLILTGKVSYDVSEYFNGDILRDFDAELELEYKLNRMLSATGSVAYEKRSSTDPSDNYEATIVEVGLRMRR